VNVESKNQNEIPVGHDEISEIGLEY